MHLREEEIGDLPIARQENLISSNECHDNSPNKGVVSSIGHEPCTVRQGTAVNALSLQGAVEANVRNADSRKIEQLGCGDERDEPVQDHGRAGAELQE